MSSTDSERVPLMNDTTRKEIDYYKNNRLWDHIDNDEDTDYRARPRINCEVYCWRSWYLSPGILSLLFGLPVLIVGVWALMQSTSYFSIVILYQSPP